MALAKAFSASDSVRPNAALSKGSTSSLRKSMTAFLPSRTTATISRSNLSRSSMVGRGTSSTEISFSSSTGMLSTGETNTMVVNVLFRVRASSRVRRITAASFK
jgi:hypothetical protein